MKNTIKKPRQLPQDAPHAPHAPSKQAVALTAIPTPSTAQLATVLGVSTRRIAQLRKSGLPCDSVAAAVEWRAAQHTTDTAEELRRQRIKLIESQRRKIDLENFARSGELVPFGSVKESLVGITSRARGELLRMASDLPPILAGETAPAIQKKLRAAIVAALTKLSDDCAKASVLPVNEH